MQNRTLLGDVRGEASGSYLTLIGAVALVGLGAFGMLGGSMDTAISGGATGGVAAPVVQAGAAEAPLPPNASAGSGGGDMEGGDVSVVVVQAGSGEGGGSMNGGDGTAGLPPGTLDDPPSSGDGGGCSGFSLCHVSNAAKAVSNNSVVRGVTNFAKNMGIDPVKMFTDPLGYARDSWDRLYGVGQFAWGMGSGIVTLANKGSELFNPMDPRFIRDLVTDPGAFFDRRKGIAEEAWRLAPGVLNMGWEMSPAGMAYDLLTGGPEKFMADRQKYASQLWENPMTQSLVQPFAECAGASSAAARNACGQIAGDVLLTIATGGAGKGLRGFGVADDVLRAGSHADEFADAGRVASTADKAGDAGRATSKVDELTDAGRTGDNAVAKTEDFSNCRNGVCTNGACFTAGTPVNLGGETRAIENVSAGMRVETLATTGAYATAVSAATHALFSFEMPNPELPGSTIEIETIRPVGTYDEALVGTTATVPLAFAEWGISGDAHLTQVSAAPSIDAGEGFVVLSTFRRESSDVYSLSFAGSDETLEPTGTHRFWSVDRADWVATRDLREGERLRTETGEVAVEGIEHKPGTHTVFNFEVEQEHTYLVGGLAVWTHNDCAVRVSSDGSGGTVRSASGRDYDFTFKQAGRSREMIVDAGNVNAARNTAQDLLESVAPAERRAHVGRLHDQAGRVTGFETGSGSSFRRVRIDIDADGPHYNVELGKGADAQRFRIDFDGTQADVDRIIQQFEDDLAVKPSLLGRN